MILQEKHNQGAKVLLLYIKESKPSFFSIYVLRYMCFYMYFTTYILNTFLLAVMKAT
jgi:hypothetical protein